MYLILLILGHSVSIAIVVVISIFLDVMKIWFYLLIDYIIREVFIN